MGTDKNRFLNEAAIGGLLHDVGKIIQRSRRIRTNHMETGARWLEELGAPWDEWAWAARFHHTHPSASVSLKDLDDPRHALLAAIIAHADHLSAAEREEITGRWNTDIPLRNVFDRVKLTAPSQEKAPTFFPIAPLADQGLFFPEANRNGSREFNYGVLEEGLQNHFSRTPKDHGPNWISRVLERYTALAPSETSVGTPGGPKRYPDVSLFDHLRTTAMLAVGLTGYVMDRHPEILEETDPVKAYRQVERTCRNAQAYPFLFVGGDIRGVQKFIYDIGSKRALRGLRSRSFFLELLQEHLLGQLLEELDMPRTQVLYVGGGHFTLVIPNTDENRGILLRFRRKMNERLLSEGGLSLALAWTAASWKTFADKEVSEAFKALGQELARQKVRPSVDILNKVLGSRHDEALSRSCPICGARVEGLFPLDPEGEAEACERCRDLIRLGGQISDGKTRYIWEASEDSSRPVLKTCGARFFLGETASDVPAEAIRVYVIRQVHSDIVKQDERFIPLPWAGYGYDNELEVVLDEGCMGAVKAAALRMDVDNLGQVFSRGLPDDPDGDGKLYSLSRVATLSRLMTLFFKDFLPVLAEKPDSRVLPGLNGPRRLVIIYAGGDDLFVIGAWNEVIEYAFDVLAAFRRFTGNNPDLTISGGIVGADDKAPVYQLAELAGKAEEHAKEHAFRGHLKDSLAILYTQEAPVPGKRTRDYAFNTREELPDLKQWMKKLTDGASPATGNDGSLRLDIPLERAFLRRILALEEMDLADNPMWRPHAAYAAGRQRREGLEKGSYTALASGASDMLRTARTAAQWVDLLIRRQA